MAMREQNDDRRFGNDRERPREVSHETRSASGANGDSDNATSGRARTGRSNRGFASMDPERQREIARKGGASVPSEKRSFSQDRGLAAQAGRKGGEASHGSRRPEDTSPAE